MGTSAKIMQKDDVASVPTKDKNWQRTNKQKKFLKKPKNKIAKKQYFKELEQTLKEPKTAEKLFKKDLKTFSKILEFADISKVLDLNVVKLVIQALKEIITDEKDELVVEVFYNLARHNVLQILFKTLIVLKEKILKEHTQLQNHLLAHFLVIFNAPLGLKRVQKLLWNTEGFEMISQPNSWEPIYFSPNLADDVKVSALWFSLRTSQQNFFSEKFVQNYVALAQKNIFIMYLRRNSATIVDHFCWLRGTLQSISQIILESEKREYLLKLVSDLPEKEILIPSESQTNAMKSHKVWGKARAFVKCSCCGVLEETKKQFQKCSRCGFVFYCNKTCQRSDWQRHKKICKELKTQD